MAQARRKDVYFFGGGKAEGRSDQRELLGGKGAGLAEMTRIGLPVPPGFTITTECCSAWHRQRGKWPRGLDTQVRRALSRLERVSRKKFGDRKNPLLVSVRSGAAVSMPGMMESILNLGLNDDTVEGLGQQSGNMRFALDAYRRLIMMYGSTARGINREVFEEQFDTLKQRYTRARLGAPDGQVVADTDVNEEELFSLINTYKRIYQEHVGQPFPQAPYEQLTGAINAVFDSWMADKAVTYRRVEKITGLDGTAVNVVQMVFGNMGEDSGTGVCFTRDPSTGENVLYGDLLMNAQGEDVVAGVRTPIKLIELQRMMPDLYEQLEAVRVMLEVHYQDMQDLEFTVERGTLYMLQCRSGKRSPEAAFRIVVEQATKGLITRARAERLVRKKLLPRTYATRAVKAIITQEQAVRRITAEDVERLFHKVVDPEVTREQLNERLLIRGINAVPGAACGSVVFSAAEAEARAAEGEEVILVRKETSPEDVGGMFAAQGVLTATGGKTSHAAVVARGWGKCCIVGCEGLRIDYAAKKMYSGQTAVSEGQLITLDGSEGEVYVGELPLVMPETPAEYNVFMGWCDKRRQLQVRSNSDTPGDASRALSMGAEGIGLCRTEHMFFDTAERRLAMQEMILADSQEKRRVALAKLLPFQRSDFEGIFEAMDRKPVTIRLVDPPLHEFLPHSQADLKMLSEAVGVPVEAIGRRAEQLKESNPMLGHRGCRLCISHPEVLDMQVTAIMEAAANCRRRRIKVYPEIMIPLSIDARELGILVERVRQVADRVLKQAGVKIDYTVGTMIETPRAALLGDQLASVAEFFSFGTNDLTQTTMALSRDDAGRFLPDYVDQDKAGIFKKDPFQSIDVAGVGLLMRWAIERGRSARPKLKIGICGEHGGDGESVRFCHELGMDYVSCSAFRVPVARLAAAQAALADGRAPGRAARTMRAAAKTRPRRKSPTTRKKRATRRSAAKPAARRRAKVAKVARSKRQVTRSKPRVTRSKRKATSRRRSAR